MPIAPLLSFVILSCLAHSVPIMTTRYSFLFTLMVIACLTALAQTTMCTTRQGDTTIITIEQPLRYLLLPIEEAAGEARVLLDTQQKDDTWMDIRLARKKTDYYVPFALRKERSVTVRVLGLPHDALTLKDGQLALTDHWNPINTDYYRPVYHHTPSYGWMNDANGMVYKDGEYHLYYQYNPYGSIWGNMHWGHAVSKDLCHWEELPTAICRDTLGHIFSGSSVVDKNNTAGYGPNAIIALYTSASSRNGQVQCMAYSTDNGRTFTKYEGNPVLRPFDGLRDFRDPKVFWYEPKACWFMIISADKETRFYTSNNLKNWEYLSSFGKGYGAQPCQYECPDFVELAVKGQPDNKKYVMLMNVNPGGPFGGSATEYFVGDFDGTNFHVTDDPDVAKWLDYGKDHYATVCFSNTGERVIALPWMSNWQYANITPTRQHRGANGLPRELSLYLKDRHYYVSADVAPEIRLLRKECHALPDAVIAGESRYTDATADYQGSFELEADITPHKNKVAGLELYNDLGERCLIYLDLKAAQAVMDRTESGITEFGHRAGIHPAELTTDKDGKQRPKHLDYDIKYINEFAMTTWAPLRLCEGKTFHLDIFVDKCSVELFIDHGRIAMTNLIFPTQPYRHVRLYTSDHDEAQFKNIRIYHLSL